MIVLGHPCQHGVDVVHLRLREPETGFEVRLSGHNER